MKIEDALIHSYAMLIMRGRCNINDIPEEYRSEVRDYITIDMNEETENNEVPFIIDDNGPLTLQKMSFTVKSGDTISIKESTVFSPDVLGNKTRPDVIKYELLRTEPQVAFEVKPSLALTKTLSGFTVRVSGKPTVYIDGMPSVVAVVKILSSNYEPMNLTIYIMIEE